jgi:hypothetical protein
VIRERNIDSIPPVPKTEFRLPVYQEAAGWDLYHSLTTSYPRMDEETVGRLLIPAERGRNETNMAQDLWIRGRRTYIENAIPKCRVPFSYFPGSRWSESYYRNTIEAFLEIKEGNLWATPNSWSEDLGMTSITRTYPGVKSRKTGHPPCYQKASCAIISTKKPRTRLELPVREWSFTLEMDKKTNNVGSLNT